MSQLLRVISLNVLRVVFVGGLLLVFATSLRWALNPAAAPQIDAVLASPEAFDVGGATEEPAQPAGTATAAPQTAVATPTEEAPEVLIAAAEPPGDTTVQVLDAGGGPANLDRAVAAIEALGYDVVSVTSSSRDVATTTVYFVGPNEPQARALRARDPRFQLVEPNQGLSEGVDLHVLVGPNF